MNQKDRTEDLAANLAASLEEILESCLIETENETSDFISDVTPSELVLSDKADTVTAQKLLSKLEDGYMSDSELNALVDMLDESCSAHPYITLRRAQLALDAFYANQKIPAVQECDRG